MNLNIVNAGTVKIAEVVGDDFVIKTTQDMLDVMVEANSGGAESLIINAAQLHADFFDLKTGLAGEILQKFSNYNMKIAVIGDFSTVTSDSLRAFIFESNRGSRVFFLPTVEEAIKKLAQ